MHPGLMCDCHKLLCLDCAPKGDYEVPAIGIITGHCERCGAEVGAMIEQETGRTESCRLVPVELVVPPITRAAPPRGKVRGPMKFGIGSKGIVVRNPEAPSEKPVEG